MGDDHGSSRDLAHAGGVVLEGDHLARRVRRLIQKSRPPGLILFGYAMGGGLMVGLALGRAHQIGALDATLLAVVAWAIGSEHEAAMWRRKLRKALRSTPNPKDQPQ